MANPQPSDPHLRVAHELLEEIMSCDFSKRQLSMILLILRLSWGCNQKWAIIPKQRDFEVAGVLDTHVKKEISWMTDARVIIVDGDRYWFNKDYDQWRVSRTRCHDRSRLTEMVSLNLTSEHAKLTEKVTLPRLDQARLKKDNSLLVIDTEINEYPDNIKTIMAVWYSVTGYGLPKQQSAQLVQQLLDDYPELDILEESKGWAAYCLDHPLKKGSSPAQQLRNRMRKAKEFQIERRQTGGKTGRHNSRPVPRSADEFTGDW